MVKKVFEATVNMASWCLDSMLHLKTCSTTRAGQMHLQLNVTSDQHEEKKKL